MPSARRERGELSFAQRLFFRPPESGLTNRRWSAWVSVIVNQRFSGIIGFLH
jgi:hypothetical protein